MSVPDNHQLDTAKKSLSNMIDFNADLEGRVTPWLIDACDALAASTGDRGQDLITTIIIDALLASTTAVASLASGGVAVAIGAAIGVASNVMAGIFNSFVTSTPTPLQGPQATMWARFAETFDCACTQLSITREALKTDPTVTWSQAFTNPVTGQQVTVADLAITPFPGQNDPAFQKLISAYEMSMRMRTWRQLIQEGYQTVGDDADADSPPHEWMASHLGEYLYNDPSQGFLRYYLACDPGPSHFGSYGDDAMGASAVAELFIDDGWGKVTNPSGVAYRADVFTMWSLGLNTTLDWGVHHPAPTPDQPGQVGWYLLDPAGTWSCGVAVGGQVVSGVTTAASGTDNVGYARRDSDGHLLYLVRTAAGSWGVNDLTLERGAPASDGVPVTSPDGQYGAYVTGGHLYVERGNGLEGENVTLSTGGPTLEPEIDIAMTATGEVIVVARTTSGIVVTHRLPPGGTSMQWGTAANVAAFPVSGSPTLSTDGQHVVVLNGPHIWHFNLATGAQEDVSTTFPVPFAGRMRMWVGTNGALALFGRRGDNGHVVQLFAYSTGPWLGNSDMTAATGGNAIGWGDPVAALDGTHIVVRGTAGQLYDFTWPVQLKSWAVQEITAACNTTVTTWALPSADPGISVGSGGLFVVAPLAP
jgi:hypothetical protein